MDLLRRDQDISGDQHGGTDPSQYIDYEKRHFQDFSLNLSGVMEKHLPELTGFVLYRQDLQSNPNENILMRNHLVSIHPQENGT